MKQLLILFLVSSFAWADTPPPGKVQALIKDSAGNSLNSTSGALNVSIQNSSLPVTGTFFQSVQPVSGTFFQTTQPVNGTLTCNAGSGTLLVNGSGSTQPVSGTVISKIQDGAGNNLTSTAVSASRALDVNVVQTVGGGGSGGTSLTDKATFTYGTGSFTPVGGVFQDTSPSLTAGQSGSSRLTAQRGMHVNLRNSSGAELLGQTTMAGSIPVAIASDQSALSVTGTFFQTTQPVSGTLTCNAGTNLNTSALALDTSVTALHVAQASTTSGQKGDLVMGATTTAAPAYTTAQTNPLSLNTSGGLRVDGSGVTQPVSGTLTCNAGTGTFTVSGTVTANIGTSGSLALDASVTGLEVTQGSTTSGQKGILHLGAVTTAAPTYTTGQSSSLSLNTSGGLRVDGSGVTQPVSGTFFQATQPVSGTFFQATQPVSNAGTFAVQAALNAGTNVIGKVSIDQTTPGTTNLVSIGTNGTVAIGTALPAGTNSIGTVQPTIYANGSASNSTTVGATAITFTPPSNAIGFVIEAESSNTVNLRYACGTTATATVGMLLEPGRDSGYVPSACTVTIISTSTTGQAAGVQWVVK